MLTVMQFGFDYDDQTYAEMRHHQNGGLGAPCLSRDEMGRRVHPETNRRLQWDLRCPPYLPKERIPDGGEAETAMESLMHGVPGSATDDCCDLEWVVTRMAQRQKDVGFGRRDLWDRHLCRAMKSGVLGHRRNERIEG